MLPWVIAHPGATVEEVCRRFGYTRKELVGDLNTVFVCGLPGYGPGDLMEAYIDDDEVIVEMADYFSRPLRLAPREALALLGAGLALVSAGLASPALERAVAKLQAVLLPAADELLVDVDEPPAVAMLRDAAAEGAVVRIEHASVATGALTVREVEPWAVFNALGRWYLWGFCRRAEAPRRFRIDRIRSVDTTGASFRPPSPVPEPETSFRPGEGAVTAVLELGPEARWVAEYYPVDVLGDDEGTMTVRFSAAAPQVAARLLVRLGTHARLLEGDAVAAAVADLRRRILARHAD